LQNLIPRLLPGVTPWMCNEVALVIHPIGINGKLEHWKSHLVELNETAIILATKVLARMKIS
jgi:hypothetical protein